MKKLPGLSDSDAAKLKLYAGHIPTNDSARANHFFFSLVEAEQEVGEPKLVRSAFANMIDDMAKWRFIIFKELIKRTWMF